jgi:hypothetical protein
MKEVDAINTLINKGKATIHVFNMYVADTEVNVLYTSTDKNVTVHSVVTVEDKRVLYMLDKKTLFADIEVIIKEEMGSAANNSRHDDTES